MPMKNNLKTLAAATLLALSLPVASAFAALQVGDKAPDFKLDAALAGKATTFSLQQALQKGRAIPTRVRNSRSSSVAINSPLRPIPAPKWRRNTKALWILKGKLFPIAPLT